jgi:hypothetical protein
MSFSVAAALQQWDWKAPAQVMVRSRLRMRICGLY